MLIDVRESLGGKELFLSFESPENLFSMLRLRLPDQKEKMLFPELKSAAIIREVHTYGQVKEIDENSLELAKTQHRGLGKKLMAKAEDIAKKAGYSKMAVISAIGTREYYKKLDYDLEGEYMVKML